MNGKLLDELNRATTPVARPSPLVVLWRWRYELALPVALVVAVDALGAYALLAALIPLWPPARSEAWGRIRCVVTAHRIRVGFVEAYVTSRRGKIPVIMWCAPAAFGERAWIWCRGGITPRQVEDGSEAIASACWASEVRVRPDERRPHRVLLEVIRCTPPVRAVPATHSARTAAPRPAADR
ncbi:hypothetical protein [Nonomuraea typhae]|uniref:hypothetical protein n=1 Tax=Nonomuraea typhae TaxID=2603600 RepID=UPI0012F95A41|nr:hypothetical protein [Nonomuraea typhae]